MSGYRLATQKDIDRIQFILYLVGSHYGLSALGSRFFFFLLTLRKMGYLGCKVSIGALTTAGRRCGITNSDRTTFRGLAELEKNGIITRQKFRVKTDRFETIIHFSQEKFDRFVREKPTSIEIPDNTYIDSQLPNWQKEDLTSKPVILPLTVNPIANVKKAKSIPKKPREKQINHPIVATLIAVLTGYKRWFACERAKREIVNMDVSNHSGVDFVHWGERWQSMSFAEREHIAKTEIAPLLLDKTTYFSKNCFAPQKQPEIMPQLEKILCIPKVLDRQNEPCSPEDIARMVGEALTLPPEEEPESPVTKNPVYVGKKANEISELSLEEYQILMAARDRILISTG